MPCYSSAPGTKIGAYSVQASINQRLLIVIRPFRHLFFACYAMINGEVIPCTLFRENALIQAF